MDRPNIRPYALHRTGYAGMQRMGGWLWSGDVNSTWETLKLHVAIGLNTSLSGIPFWGSDIGGFYPTGLHCGVLRALVPVHGVHPSTEIRLFIEVVDHSYRESGSLTSLSGVASPERISQNRGTR